MQEITGSWKKNFDYRFISAEDLDGKIVTMTIKAIGKDTAFNSKSKQKEDVVVLSFIETEKMMILNKTNAKMITKLTGTPIVEKWKGVKIKLASEKINVAGESMYAIRVQPDFNAMQR